MRQININRQKLGVEDLLFGTGTEEQTRGNQLVTVSKINAGNLPFDSTRTLIEFAQQVNLEQLGAAITELKNINSNLSTFITVEDNLDILATLENSITHLNSLYTNLQAILQAEGNATSAANSATLATSKATAAANSATAAANSALSISGHLSSSSNPHSVTKAQVGLGSVNNTTDSSKVVASAAKLTTARTISITGDATGSTTFDGSADKSISINVLDSEKIGGISALQATGVNSGALDVDPNTTADEYIMTNHANTPHTSSYWHIRTQFYLTKTSISNRAQIAIKYNSGGKNSVYTRSTYNGNWSAWENLSVPIVGTVAQTSGIPTGAIIESGSNANGVYTKFADGTMICTGIYNGAITMSPYIPGLYQALMTVTFPATFSSTLYTLSASGPNSAAQGIGGIGSTITVTSASIFYLSAASTVTASNVRYSIIGRWF